MKKRSTKRKILPLQGRRIVVTRRREQAGPLRDALKSKGATVLELPTIAIQPPRSWRRLDEAVKRLADYDWLLFTSTNGVDSFVARLKRQRKTARAFARCRVAAIGPATAKALRRRGVRAHVVPEEFRAEGLLRALGNRNWRGKRVLLARAARARELLPRELRRRGARVNVVEVYRTVVPAASRRRAGKMFSRRKPDAITFTSSSTVRNFLTVVGRQKARRMLDGVAVACIGPVTSRTARALGLRVAVEARHYTIPGLAQALARYFQNATRNRRSGKLRR